MKYGSAPALRAALEQRLTNQARAGELDLARARKQIAFVRLLDRLSVVAPDGWVLKGGFALELRLPGRARATRDLDIDWRVDEASAFDALSAAAAHDSHDYFEFQVERAQAPADVGAGGGVRYRASAYLAGRLFEEVMIDVGPMDEPYPPPERLRAPDVLAFAEIRPPTIPIVPLEQHLADKIHAYTRTHGRGEASSRPKDLIDIVLIAHLGTVDAARLRVAVERVFSSRATHDLPRELPQPPVEWEAAYRRLALEVGVDPSPGAGHALATRLLAPVFSTESGVRSWSPETKTWR